MTCLLWPSFWLNSRYGIRQLPCNANLARHTFLLQSSQNGKTLHSLFAPVILSLRWLEILDLNTWVQHVAFLQQCQLSLIQCSPCKSLRSVSCIKQAACMQVLGSDSADGPWLKAITERVMNIYCERLSGYAWCSQASLLPALGFLCTPVPAMSTTANASLQQCTTPLDTRYSGTAILSTPTMYHCVILINSRVQHC